MIIKSSISYPGKEKNEDLLILHPTCIGILDGSSGLGGEDFGADRFVASYAEHFIDFINQNESLTDAVNHALDCIKNEYLLSDGTVPPSASLLIIKENDNDLQILSIGDCYCIVFFRNGDYRLIYKDEVAPFDQAVINRLIELHNESGNDISDLLNTDEIQRLLLCNRKKMNTSDGYRILAPNMTSIVEDEIISLSKNDICNLVIFSDGFASKINDFIHKKWNLESVYSDLRKEELSDTSLNNRPRLKVSDDASAIVALLD